VAMPFDPKVGSRLPAWAISKLGKASNTQLTNKRTRFERAVKLI
jgi:hypothetical protein